MPSADPLQNASSPRRIYVASLRDYNNGRLHGAWLEVGSSVDELVLGVRAMLRRSIEVGAEEWAIHDFEGFGDIRISENARLETVLKLAANIDRVSRTKNRR